MSGQPDQSPAFQPDGKLATPLRARLYNDGSLVIDNPARPIVARPMRHDGLTEYTEFAIESELDARSQITAAILLAHRAAQPETKE